MSDMTKIDRLTITARYAETDMMGIIHHSVYPVWYEAARTHLLHSAGMSYGQLEKEGIMLPLTKLECQYLHPLHYEDEVVIETRIAKLTAARMEFSYRAVLNGQTMAEGMTLHGFVDSSTFRPVNIKKIRPELYAMLEEKICTDWCETDGKANTDI